MHPFAVLLSLRLHSVPGFQTIIANDGLIKVARVKQNVPFWFRVQEDMEIGVTDFPSRLEGVVGESSWA